MLRKVLALFFLLTFLSLTGFLIYSAIKPQLLPIGSELPGLSYITENGSVRLMHSSSLSTMIVYFHTECEYCQYELKLFDQSLEKFMDAKIILLTPEEDFFKKQKMSSWTSLSASAHVTWGIVDQDKFGELFGSKGFPATYIFDRRGTLRSKIFGEAKLDLLLSELKKSRKSGHEVSGYN